MAEENPSNIFDELLGLEERNRDDMNRAVAMGMGESKTGPAPEAEGRMPDRNGRPGRRKKEKDTAPEKIREKRPAGRDSVQQTIRLSPEARTGIKHMAADENRTISEIIEGWYWEHAGGRKR